jgi:hypothetical protein
VRRRVGGDRLGHGDHRPADSAGAVQHVGHAAFQPVAVGEDGIRPQEAGNVGAGGAEQMRVHALADQAGHHHRRTADAARQLGHHGGGGQDRGPGWLRSGRRAAGPARSTERRVMAEQLFTSSFVLENQALASEGRRAVQALRQGAGRSICLHVHSHQ